MARLQGDGATRDDAIRDLHDLLLRASRHIVARMPMANSLGGARREEVVHSAANEATTAVLRRLDSFQGRSRFTTWAYKFAVLHAATEVRRIAWRHRETGIDGVREPASTAATPEQHADFEDLRRAVRDAIQRVLTPHQRRVALALLVEGVPIDVLAERLGSNRNALYKALHDARSRLRSDLVARGYLVRRSSAKEIS